VLAVAEVWLAAPVWSASPECPTAWDTELGYSRDNAKVWGQTSQSLAKSWLHLRSQISLSLDISLCLSLSGPAHRFLPNPMQSALLRISKGEAGRKVAPTRFPAPSLTAQAGKRTQLCLQTGTRAQGSRAVRPSLASAAPCAKHEPPYAHVRDRQLANSVLDCAIAQLPCSYR
jgi:hypothetical protein